MKIKPIYFLGVDLAKDSFHYRLDDTSGKLLRAGVVANTREDIDAFVADLLALVPGRPGSFHAGMEATGRHGRLLWSILATASIPTSVINPAQIKAFARSINRRGKNDTLDAATIATFVRRNAPYTAVPEPGHLAQLRELTREIDHLVAESVRVKHRLSEVADSSEPVAESLRRQLENIATEIARMESSIAGLCREHDDLRQSVDLLCTIPGVAKRTASRVLAQIGSKSFSSGRQLSAYSGTSPAQNLSGSSLKGKTRLCKRGNGHLRKALYMPALTLWRKCLEIKAWADAIAARLGSRKAALGAVMRKLIHIIHGVLKHRKPFDPSRVTAPAN